MSDKIIHRGKHVNARGQVSALCFAAPKAIDLKRESWTVSDEAVTCPECLRALAGDS